MTMTRHHGTARPDHRWIAWLRNGLGRLTARRRAHLDVRDLSPHLQRDLGLLDGNGPLGRRG